ncbi:hypothetical protein CBL_21249, partial [Carabus blaptoides fortunei]
PNSTHLCQPHDVAVFRPVKSAWRKVLMEWKTKNKGAVPKTQLPALLKNMLRILQPNMSKSIKRGFESSGIIPVDAQKIIIKLIPAGRKENLDHSALADSFSEIINKATNVKERIATKRSKKINIIAGKSTSLVDLRARSSASESNQILDDIQTTPTEEHSDTKLSETEENENSETDENCSIEQSETEQTETQDLKVPVTKICDILQDS